MRLHYNATTGTTYNSPGVETRVPPYFVKTEKDTYYYEKFIEVLEKYGYKRNVSIKLAPYDWRKGPRECHYYRKIRIYLFAVKYSRRESNDDNR